MLTRFPSSGRTRWVAERGIGPLQRSRMFESLVQTQPELGALQASEPHPGSDGMRPFRTRYAPVSNAFCSKGAGYEAIRRYAGAGYGWREWIGAGDRAALRGRRRRRLDRGPGSQNRGHCRAAWRDRLALRCERLHPGRCALRDDDRATWRRGCGGCECRDWRVESNRRDERCGLPADHRRQSGRRLFHLPCGCASDDPGWLRSDRHGRLGFWAGYAGQFECLWGCQGWSDGHHACAGTGAGAGGHSGELHQPRSHEHRALPGGAGAPRGTARNLCRRGCRRGAGGGAARPVRYGGGCGGAGGVSCVAGRGVFDRTDDQYRRRFCSRADPWEVASSIPSLPNPFSYMDGAALAGYLTGNHEHRSDWVADED